MKISPHTLPESPSGHRPKVHLVLEDEPGSMPAVCNSLPKNRSIGWVKAPDAEMICDTCSRRATGYLVVVYLTGDHPQRLRSKSLIYERQSLMELKARVLGWRKDLRPEHWDRALIFRDGEHIGYLSYNLTSRDLHGAVLED